MIPGRFAGGHRFDVRAGRKSDPRHTMIIVFKPNSPEKEIRQVEKIVRGLGYDPRLIKGVEHTVLGAVGDENSNASLEVLRNMPCVERVVPIQKKYKLASREFHPRDSIIRIGNEPFGGKRFQIIAGSCAVESEAQMDECARMVIAAGARLVRGGTFKPRTSPYDFQGLGMKGVEILAEIRARYKVPVVTEVVGIPHLKAVAKRVDCLQIGARNCQNYNLLEAVADMGKPVLLKRGMATTVEEWLNAAEYLLVHNCPNVILCERGIRTFETSTRNTLDVGAVAVAKRNTHLPVIVDPSHAAGKLELVLPLARAAVAVGADGLLVESHPNPVEARSDAAQQIPCSQFKAFVDALRPLVEAMGRKL